MDFCRFGLKQRGKILGGFCFLGGTPSHKITRDTPPPGFEHTAEIRKLNFRIERSRSGYVILQNNFSVENCSEFLTKANFDRLSSRWNSVVRWQSRTCHMTRVAANPNRAWL